MLKELELSRVYEVHEHGSYSSVSIVCFTFVHRSSPETLTHCTRKQTPFRRNVQELAILTFGEVLDSRSAE